MFMVQPGVDPQRMVDARVATAHREAEHRDRLRIAKAARCATRGCHPVLETVSATIVAIGGWLNRRAAPPERWVRISGSPRTTQPA